ILFGLHRQLFRRERRVVETLGELEERGISAIANCREDFTDTLPGLAVDGRRRAIERAQDGRRSRDTCVETADHVVLGGTGDSSRRIVSMRAVTRAWAVLSDARFTINRAVDVMISATSTRPLARRVSPDCTRSTMRSAKPTSGASSIEPSRRTI